MSLSKPKIMKLAQIDPLLVEVHLPIAVFPVIKEGMNVGRDGAYCDGIGHKVLDTASDTFGVRLMVPNPTHDMPAGVNCTATFSFVGR